MTTPRAHPRVAAALGPGSGWHDVEHLGEVTSTHDVTLERLRAGDPIGLVVVADHQTAGRGRRGRGWDDAASPGASLTFTASRPVPAAASLAPLAVALAVRDAVSRFGLLLELKWPNDLLVDGRKCVGILIERHALCDYREAALVGVGIDVDWRHLDRDGERAGWTSLAEETGRPVDRWELLGEVLDAISSRWQQLDASPGSVLDSYRQACSTIGATIRAELPDGATVEGRATDLDQSGQLLVDTARGRVTLAVADVEHVRDLQRRSRWNG